MTRRRDRWFPHRLPQRDRAACVDAVVDHDVSLAVACMENTRQGGNASPRRAPRRQHHKIIARGSPGCSSVNIMWTDVEQRPKVRSRLPRSFGKHPRRRRLQGTALDSSQCRSPPTNRQGTRAVVDAFEVLPLAKAPRAANTPAHARRCKGCPSRGGKENRQPCERGMRSETMMSQGRNLPTALRTCWYRRYGTYGTVGT